MLFAFLTIVGMAVGCDALGRWADVPRVLDGERD